MEDVLQCTELNVDRQREWGQEPSNENGKIGQICAVMSRVYVSPTDHGQMWYGRERNGLL